MSHNPDTVDVLVNENFRISGRALLAIAEDVDLPEGCFLHDMPLPGTTRTAVSPRRPVPPWDADTEYPIGAPRWYGEGSGSRWNLLIEKVLPRTMGRADLVYCWERGEDFIGIRVVDGRVTEHEVVRTLGREKRISS